MTDTPASSNSTVRRDAKIVDTYLPDGYSAEPNVVASGVGDQGSASAPNLSDTPAESSLKLQGGDIHRDIFKVKARAKAPQRSATFAGTGVLPRLHDDEDVLAVNEQRLPGGFRRQHMQRKGLHRTLSAAPVTSNFISFLELYGSFAGEDLRDSDDDDDESAIDDGDDEQPSERRPLLGRRKSSRRPKKEGDASTTKTFFTLLKAFIGTGIMFLPKAFRNGGILFSSITLIMVSIISTVCFRLLLQARKKYGGGYGELAGAIVGPRLRSLVLASITLSQLGFVCAGIIFTAENLYAFLDAVTKNRSIPVDITGLIALQLVILVPLALIRNISKLGPAALLADVFILIGLVYIWWYDIGALAFRGMDKSVTLFNPASFTLTIGSAIFTFEGIGLLLPIQSSMAEPEKFPMLLYIIMFIITAIFTSVGALCYATFGEDTMIQVISNYPQDSPLVNSVQFLYCLAVLVGNPVQLFPAVRIIETSLFGEKATGKRSLATKWKKNALRVGMMVAVVLISIVGAADLDK